MVCAFVRARRALRLLGLEGLGLREPGRLGARQPRFEAVPQVDRRLALGRVHAAAVPAHEAPRLALGPGVVPPPVRLGAEQQAHSAGVEEPRLWIFTVVCNLEAGCEEQRGGQRQRERDERHDERVARVGVVRERVARVVLRVGSSASRQAGVASIAHASRACSPLGKSGGSGEVANAAASWPHVASTPRHGPVAAQPSSACTSAQQLTALA